MKYLFFSIVLCVLNGEVLVNGISFGWWNNSRREKKANASHAELKGKGIPVQCGPGLQNLGNTCYLNSLLQSLYYARGYRAAVLRGKFEEGSVGGALQSLFRAMADSTDCGEPQRTDELARALGVNPTIQEDAQEFFLNLVNAVDASESNRKACTDTEAGLANSGTGGHGNGKVSQTLSGEMEQFIQCIDVDFFKHRSDPFLDLSVDVQGESTLESSLVAMVTADVLDGDNKYRTSNHGLQRAKKGQIITANPQVLYVHLKRFSFDAASGTLTKLNNRFVFPTTLDLAPYMKNTEGKCSTEGYSKMYELQTVIMHEGNAMQGHYTAFVRPNLNEPTRWVHINDHLLSEVSQDDVNKEAFGGESMKMGVFGGLGPASRNAYILQYVRT